MFSTEPLNLLVAYPYMTANVIETIRSNKDRVRFLLDSGAFTAWKAGKTISLDHYCRFIESLPTPPWRYFALDVIGDPKATVKNYELMLSRGFKPIPVFTRGENPSLLDDYFRNSDVVAIGGLVGTRQNTGFVKGIMKKIGTRKVHFLGFTRLPFLKRYKPYMADSSTWETSARFASCPIYLGSGHPLVNFTKTTVRQLLKNRAVLREIKRCNLDPSDFLKNEKWAGGNSSSRKLGARSMVYFSHDVGKNLGTNLFLAAATAQAIRLLLEGLECAH